MSGWIPYWTTDDSVATFLSNADLFSDISPFWHSVSKDANSDSGLQISNHALSSGTRASVLAQIKGKGALIMPSITDGTGKGTMSGVLQDTVKRTAFIEQVADMVQSNGYDGIDLDFETFAFTDGSKSWAATRPAWVTFVTELAAELHTNDKQLAVAVPPMYNSLQNGSSGYWVYDFAGISPHVDKIRIMAYDYAYSSPGPIGGPLSWVENVARFAAGVAPPGKVQLGTPTYGRDWVKSATGVGCPSLSSNVYKSRNIATSISGLAESSWKRDPASLERFVNYKLTYNGGKCVVRRAAWMSDSTTVIARAQIADKYGLSGQALWMVGTEQPNLWAPLRNIALGQPVDTVNITSQAIAVKASRKRVRRGGTVKIKGRVSPARPRVKVNLQRRSGSKWVTITSMRTNAGGGYSITARPGVRRAKYRILVRRTSGYSRALSGTVVIRTF